MVKDINQLGVRLTINGEVKQEGNSAEMLNPIVPLIQHIAGHFRLLPGDVVLTGTPAGVGKLNQQDQLVMELIDYCAAETHVLD